MADILTSQSSSSDIIKQSSVSEPFITVVIPTRNEEKYIEDTIRGLMSQTYPKHRFEVIVADGCSTDKTAEIIRGLQELHSNLILVDNPRQRSSAGRNVGVRKSRGEIVVIVDGHCQLDNENYLLNLAEAFHRSGADCIGRPQPLDVTEASNLQLAIAKVRSCWLGHHSDSFIYSSTEQFVPPQSVAVAYRKSVFDTVGLFDENFDACEDMEFNYRVDRAGLNCFFTPKVSVRYFPRSSLRDLFRQLTRYGRGRVRLLRKHSETFSLASFVPALFLVGLACGFVASFFSPVLRQVYASVLGLYVSVVVAVSLLVSARSGNVKILLWLPFVFATVHAGAGFGVLAEVVAGKPMKKNVVVSKTLIKKRLSK